MGEGSTGRRNWLTRRTAPTGLQGQHGDKVASSDWRSPSRPAEKSAEQVGRITGKPGKSDEGEGVADGFVVALMRGNARGAKGPCCR